MPRFTNLLEAAAPADLPREVQRLLDHVERGRMQVQLGDLRESIGSGWFTQLTADLAHKRLLKGFEASQINNNDWRKIAYVNPNVPDFKFQNAIRTAGYSSLDSVPESGRYKSKIFTEEKAQYKIAKYGNVESWSLEAMANDELGKLGRTMERFGGAAARTLLNFVFNTLIDANPTCTYDSVALFASGHSNNLGATTPLSAANLEAAWKKMRAQTGLGGEKLNLMPKLLIVHTDEEVLAHRIVNTELMMAQGLASTSAFTEGPRENFFRGKLEVVATPYVTSGRWYLAADPSQCDTLEVGFFRGNETPEIFMEAPGSGFEFEFDATRTKVRYIFGGTPMDHRWIVRGNVA